MLRCGSRSRHRPPGEGRRLGGSLHLPASSFHLCQPLLKCAEQPRPVSPPGGRPWPGTVSVHLAACIRFTCLRIGSVCRFLGSGSRGVGWLFACSQALQVVLGYVDLRNVGLKGVGIWERSFSAHNRNNYHSSSTCSMRGTF